MKTRGTFSKLLTFMLALVIVLSMMPVAALAETASVPGAPVIVIAGSDFQNSGGNEAGAVTVNGIIDAMQAAGYSSANGFLSCGDYDYEYTETSAGINTLKTVLNEQYGLTDNMVFTQGNHDTAGSAGLSPSGNNDAADYGVFVINEDDYMWHNDNETTVKNTAASLKSYLDAKAAESYSKPIFILSHLPLHYSMRTKLDGDAKYANYIFNVINQAGASGLNIIFLYGHDHSNGWDDYLGGSAVYLAKGDSINIAQASQTSFQSETLNFTYMNAGYTGYYSNVNTGSETELTMTVFEIGSESVSVKRFSQSGMYNLKSAGVTNSYKGESGYSPNTAVYTSPQTVMLNTVITGPTVFTDQPTGITVTTIGTAISVTPVTDVQFENTAKYSSYSAFDIVVDGYTDGTSATVTIPAAGYSSLRTRVYSIAEDGTLTDMNAVIKDGTATFTTSHFSKFAIAELAAAAEKTYYRVTSLSDIVSEGKYLIIYNGGANAASFMKPEVVTRQQRTGFELVSTSDAGADIITGDNSIYEWTLTQSGSGWTLGASGGSAKFEQDDVTGRINAILSSDAHVFTIGGSANAFTFTDTDYNGYVMNYNGTGVLINGYNGNAANFYIYKLDESVPVDPSGTWVEIPVSTTVFRLTDSLTAGKKYLIANSKDQGSANIVVLSGSSITSGSATVEPDSAGNYIIAPSAAAQWTFTDASKLQNVESTGTYLRGNSALASTTNSGRSYTSWSYSSASGLSTSDTNGWYTNYYYIGANFSLINRANTTDRVYIYEESTAQLASKYARLSGQTEFSISNGEYADQAAVEAMIRQYITVSIADDANGTSAAPTNEYYFTGTLLTDTDGIYSLSVVYEGKTLGTVTVGVASKAVSSVAVSPMTGSVERGAVAYAVTGSMLTVTYDDGSVKEVPVTVSMLEGSFDVKTEGAYPGLTVSYGGKSVSGYTLNVVPRSGNDYPVYPNEGAVRVGKSADTSEQNFQSTGVAKVELSATGVPMNRGVDLVIVLDTSSSMTDTVDGRQRIVVLREALADMLASLSTSGTGGTVDIDTAITQFNGYTYIDADNDHLTGGVTRGNNGNTNRVLTGNQTATAGGFEEISALAAGFDTASVTTSSGTNYDAALEMAYDLLASKQAANSAAGQEREQFMVFMSDGAPFQYNYFGSYSDTANWNTWLQGTQNNADSASDHSYFYNGTGNRHRMAEAIKGSPDASYDVIKNDSSLAAENPAYITQVPGLGATVFSIGFCLAQDNQITVESMEHVLSGIASDAAHFKSVTTADELNNTFNAIASTVKKAGSSAYFTDTMGPQFKLQTAASVTKGDGTVVTLNKAPQITVSTYDLYTRAEYESGIIGLDMVGTRKSSTPTVLETVTFNAAGTEAYSSVKGAGTNILADGVIAASSFWYNLSSTQTKTITLADGSSYELAPETFYWNIGDITEKEISLSYYVYLEGSMEGELAEGSYPTNTAAVLYYQNWLDNSAHKDTVSPVVPWGGANVSYAFYLVDANGTPITEEGIAVGFADAAKLTKPVVYSYVKLNSGESVSADIAANQVLPEGYVLYDEGVVYNVSISSDGTGSWLVTNGAGISVDTTYVAEYGGTPTTSLSSANVNQGQNDYTHTVVWFAVKYSPKCIPDAVVIDYGLPVDISVLANDMFGEKGTLAGVGAAVPAGVPVSGDTSLNAGFAASYAGSFGTASVNGTKVRYQVANMEMSASEELAYAAKYETTGNYFYGKVTVIPASTVYYEDSFVTFSEGDWNQQGSAAAGAVQSEDRLGSFSLSTYDANNIYGFDPAYKGFSEYSLGSTMKTTVTAANNPKNGGEWPEAQFTFKGTGFDIISLTSNSTGFINVLVYSGTDTSATPVKNWAVDTYYGYTRTAQTDASGAQLYNKYTWVQGADGAMHIASTEQVTVVPEIPEENTTYEALYTWSVTQGDNALYQIPVIKGEGFDYGTYTVKIVPMYSSAFDHNSADGAQYDFYLDAIRIYDPAGSTLDSTYAKDGEGWPDYFEVRNNLIGANSFSDSSSASGIVFIDGVGNTDSISDYTNYGPNNEVYLANGQAIAFGIDGDLSNLASVQIGLKGVNGASSCVISNGKSTKTVALNTATDMYYDVTDIVSVINGLHSGYIAVVNNTSGSAIVSVTDVKLTYKTAPSGASNLMLMTAKSSADSATLMVRSMFAPALEEVKEVFEPETFSVSLGSSSVRAGRSVSVKVTTSADVEYITVNDSEITSFKRDRRTGLRVWTASVKPADAGEYAVSVTAYNAEGTASEPVEKTLAVKASLRSDIKRLFSGLFSWL